MQAAGSDYSTAHELVSAVVETIKSPYVDPAADEVGSVGPHGSSVHTNGLASKRLGFGPQQISARLETAGYAGSDNLLVTLAVHLTTASPAIDLDVHWIASTVPRVGDANMLLEAAGVVFAFNTINRIADARRVQLEYQFVRGLKPFKGWIERRLASLAGLAYDLSFKHQPRHSQAALLNRVEILWERLASSTAPDLFAWLSRSPVVLEGVIEMIDSNVRSAGVRSDLLKEAMAIGAASKAMPGSGLLTLVEQYLPAEALRNSKTLKAWAAPLGGDRDSDLVAACRRYAWQVANAAYTVTDEQILKLYALGLSDAELLDLTLATAVFSALAIIEPIAAAVASASVAAEETLPSAERRQVQVA